MRLSKYYNAVFIEQTRSAIDSHYKKLLNLFSETLGKKYVGICVSFINLLLTDLIPSDVSNLNLIRSHLAKVKHTIALKFLFLEESEKQRLTNVVNAEERPRLRELFKLVALYHQPDEYMDQKKLKEAEIAALKISDIPFRTTKLQKLVILHSNLKQFDHATRVAELIPDPKIQTEYKHYILSTKVFSIVNDPSRF